MIDLTTTLNKLHFKTPLMNAAGVHCATTTELDDLLDSQAGGLVTKSATLQPRTGNPDPRYANLPFGSINSMGLPNQGLDYYLNYANATALTHPDFPILLSLAGQSLAENLQMLERIQASAFSGLTELNLSCPNVPGKPQIGYDFDQMKTILTAVFQTFNQPLGIKLPPYFDLAQFDLVADILNQFPLAFINTINSVGNGLFINLETETTVIKPKGGFGGIGGSYVKPVALANVRAFRQRLNPAIQIIGTGGVVSGGDLFELILCGADVVQIGTTLAQEGTPAFGRILTELERIMAQKGYATLADFRGNLKTL
ncbi:dihydroorotate dehydrogenase 1A [Lactobacillus selangorensis]|uniref:Dihydroorotate dehydrogenase n=1 Tax=Lactobacillus selangorensis TaxID=81857 RepID=A0A0R2FXT9_9LACO|nr:dihydroorotate oxidase [Lactobacillus selangorensis]KRN28670.1 dihydroorotate dehydrogenase 1A [Lactobacillus selangorensis]KRN32920.1 dihydroorotate dehydrogenase 1A [Lactobacillus selangorensis]